MEILYLDGYGIYVWPAYIFTILSFSILYYSIKLQLEKERKLFIENFDLLNAEKIKLAYQSGTNRKILAER
jgi:heme exporter protein D|tara:strand:+ start:1399 stop:1611 length:213 start_codon:yes stop_codon:yes gene_type:complete